MYIGIFSSTQHLWDTTIKYEVLDILQHNHSVVLIKEYEDINIGSIEKEITVHDVSYMNDTIYMPIVDSFTKSFRLKKEIIDHYCEVIDILIIHSDVDYKALIYISFLKSKAIIVRRTPSPLISPQNDWVWLKEHTNIFKHLITTIYFFYLLYPLITLNFIKIRINLFPTENKLYSDKHTNIFTSSYCYSASCKRALASMNENSNIINFPKSAKTDKFPNVHKLLLLPSDDIPPIMAFKNCKLDEAKEIFFEKLTEIIQFSEKHNLQTDIKLKFDNESVHEFINDNFPSTHWLDTNTNLSDIIDDYKYIVGFNSTPLWRQSLINSRQILISLQLIDCDHYNYYKYHNNIQFVESMSKVKIDNRKLDKLYNRHDNGTLIDALEKL